MYKNKIIKLIWVFTCFACSSFGLSTKFIFIQDLDTISVNSKTNLEIIVYVDSTRIDLLDKQNSLILFPSVSEARISNFIAIVNHDTISFCCNNSNDGLTDMANYSSMLAIFASLDTWTLKEDSYPFDNKSNATIASEKEKKEKIKIKDICVFTIGNSSNEITVAINIGHPITKKSNINK
jgi:hypothetical protein